MQISGMNLRTYSRPLVDGQTYLARVVGIAYLGHRKEPILLASQTPRVVPEIMFAFEFLDERTLISPSQPLVMNKIMGANVHPKSRFHQLAKMINPAAITSYTQDVCSDSEEEDEDGLGQSTTYEISTSQLVYGLVKITVRESKKHTGVFMISDIKEPTTMEKFLSTEAPILTPYVYDLVTDNLIQGNREDMPKKLLKRALNSMIN